jgi:hypothetical protein
MSQAYAPALQVLALTKVAKVRELPLPGKNLVAVGAQVKANTPVLSAELPGDLTIVRVADRLGFDPCDIAGGMKVQVGDKVEQGVVLCEIKTFFGLFTSRLTSPVDGVVEFFTDANAHLGVRHEAIPLYVNAYIEGIVSHVEEGKSATIETEGSLIQGIFGVGGERQGVVLPLPFANNERIDAACLKGLGQNLAQKILIGGAFFTNSALQEAAACGVSAVVTGSIDAQTLTRFVGYEIGVSVTGDEPVPLTLIITEGFGALPISNRIMDLAHKLAGRPASVNGATQVRAGATRPEIIVPLPSENRTANVAVVQEAKALELGAQVRIIRVPYFGELGLVTSLPVAPQQIESGALVRVLGVRLAGGEEVIVPRANVELV